MGYYLDFLINVDSVTRTLLNMKKLFFSSSSTDYAWVTAEEYRQYKVMDGMDEDILYLCIWTRSCLNEDGLPAACN